MKTQTKITSFDRLKVSQTGYDGGCGEIYFAGQREPMAVVWSFAVFAVCGVLTAMIRRGRTPQYIRQLYDDMCLLFSTPQMFGKEITMTDIMHSLESDYGIDWDKLEVHIEDEKHWVTGARKGVR